MSHGPGLGDLSVLVKSVYSIPLAIAVVPSPRAEHGVSPRRATQSEWGRGDSPKSNQCATTEEKLMKFWASKNEQMPTTDRVGLI